MRPVQMLPAAPMQGREDVNNGTVYEFDVKKLRELCASKANMVDHGSNSDGHGPMISQINGRTLLLFYYGNVNMGYQIVTYKDITDVIEKSHLLFFQTGGFTLSLIVVMGIILYLSLRKITAPLTGLREATLLKVFMILKYRQREIQNLRR